MQRMRPQMPTMKISLERVEVLEIQLLTETQRRIMADRQRLESELGAVNQEMSAAADKQREYAAVLRGKYGAAADLMSPNTVFDLKNGCLVVPVPPAPTKKTGEQPAEGTEHADNTNQDQSD